MVASKKLNPSPPLWALGHFLTHEGLLDLVNFKYAAGAYTTLDLFLNPWWLFVAKFVPRWVSPNAVTLTGLTGVVIAVVLTVLVRQEEPATYINGHSVHLLSAAFMFTYQTLDAVDGKHARNTGQSTPLGAVFDHGCDAFVMSLNALLVEFQTSHPGTEADDAGGVVGSLAALVPMVSFFAGQWEHYHTGVIEAGGVTESQYACMALAIVSALCGPALFQTKLVALVPGAAGLPSALLDASVKQFMAFGVVGFAVLILVGCVARSVKTGSASLLHMAGSFLPAAVQLAFCLSICRAEVYREHRLLCLTAGLMGFADLNIRMVLAGVGQFRFPVLHLTLVPFAVVSLLGFCIPLEVEVHVAMVALVIVWQVVSILWLACDSITQICEQVKIPFLAPVRPKGT
mmetsp:Transcript_20020/g.69484  ORF Transcript_20020/g.69484 Transcript_20020/m.69484 type:complete len:401 (-) Transcript_20020:110-1312(-)